MLQVKCPTCPRMLLLVGGRAFLPDDGVVHVAHPHPACEGVVRYHQWCAFEHLKEVVARAEAESPRFRECLAEARAEIQERLGDPAKGR